MDSVKGGDAILARVREHLGAVRQADLCLSRQERRVVQRLVDSGQLRRHPSGLIAEPGVDERVLVARLHRGLVTCLHAAAHYRLPVPYPPGPVHVLTPKGSTAPRLRHEHLHETRGHSAAPPQSFPVVSEARCVADVLCCAEEWTAMVVVDAALRRGRVSADQIASHLRGSRRHLGRVRLSRASARARSPLETLDPVDLPGTMRFIARSVRGELELTRGRVRAAALIQRVSLRYAGHWRSIMGAGSQWELYILSMCLVTDVELSADDAVELDAGAVRARAVPLLRDALSDPASPQGAAPRQRDIPTIMAFAAAVGLSTMAAAPAGSDRRAAGAELVATALAVGTNQTCRLLSHDYLRTRTEQLDARALATAEGRIRSLDRLRHQRADRGPGVGACLPGTPVRRGR